jgi:hypothetical protein
LNVHLADTEKTALYSFDTTVDQYWLRDNRFTPYNPNSPADAARLDSALKQPDKLRCTCPQCLQYEHAVELKVKRSSNMQHGNDSSTPNLIPASDGLDQSRPPMEGIHQDNSHPTGLVFDNLDANYDYWDTRFSAEELPQGKLI